ncbi:MAG: riboflavin synthase [Acidimicrobiales bacterium]|nr:riboflavin synthase [Acidimicrobiales bacterium]
MFTGIVEEIGTLTTSTLSESRPSESQPSGSDRPGSEAARLVFGARQVLDGTRIGDSISVNGCCLTVVELGADWWAAEAVPETLSRTNLGRLSPGDPVNLERALRAGDRLGGHLVQGHVDGVGRVVAPAPELEIAAPDPVRHYLVEKGSICVDGVSLTVVGATADGFTVAVIPHTMEVTTIGRLRPGDEVNLEVDVIAKYTERLLTSGTPTPYAGLAPSDTPARREGAA